MTEIKGRIGTPNGLRGQLGGSGGGGSDNYPDLKNKPKINGHTLLDDQTPADLEMKLSQLENDEGFVTIDDDNVYNDATWSSEKIRNEILFILPTGTESGSLVSFRTSLPLPLDYLKADIDYDANGVDEVKLYQLGGNFFDKNSENIRSGSLINGGGNEVSYADWSVSDFIPVVEGEPYYLYGITNHPNTQQDNFELFDENNTKIGFANVKTYDQPYVIPEGVKYVKFSLKDSDMNTAQFGVSKNNGYEPYNAITNIKVIDISNYSVYGGYIEITPNGATLTSTKNADGTDKAVPEVYELSDVHDFGALVNTTNNIFADSGNVSVTYKKSINDAIAELQALILS